MTLLKESSTWSFYKGMLPLFFRTDIQQNKVWMTAPEGSLFFSQFLLRLSIQGYVMTIVSSIKIKSFCFKMGGMRIKRNQK